MTIPHRSYRRARIHKKTYSERPAKHDANYIIMTTVPPSALADDLEPRASIRVRTHTLTTCTLLLSCPLKRASIISTRGRPIYPNCVLSASNNGRPIPYHDMHWVSHTRVGGKLLVLFCHHDISQNRTHSHHL